MRFIWAGITLLVGIVMLPIMWSFIDEMNTDTIAGLPGLTTAEAAFPALLAIGFFVLVIVAFLLVLRGRGD